VCGTVADSTSGVDSTLISINKGAGVGTGMTCEQSGHPDHFNQQCANYFTFDSGTASAWNRLFTYGTGTYTITVKATDVAGNETIKTFASFTIT